LRAREIKNRPGCETWATFTASLVDTAEPDHPVHSLPRSCSQRLDHRLVGSTNWVESDGTSFTRKVWRGRADLEEFETDSPAGGHIEGLTLRLYVPQTHQWSLYWATSKSGAMGVPTVGEFKNGRGEFFDTEPSGPNGRSILCRFVWTNTNTDTPHFEQSFSEDGGKTWEVNCITDQLG
jgi:hypothetical protein